MLVWYPADRAPEADWFAGSPSDPLFHLGRSAEGVPVSKSNTKYPLIVLSHGTGGSAQMLAWLGEELARAGYVVAAVNHHGNTSAESSPAAAPYGFMLWWERATDLSRVVDSLLKDSQFAASIDLTKIGAAGFSLGGYTVLAVVGAKTSLTQWGEFCGSPRRDATCEAQPEFPEMFAAFEKVRQEPVVRASLERSGDSFRDPRFLAVFAIAPVGSWLTSDSLSTIKVPVRLVVGTADRTAPAAAHGQRIAELVPGARLSLLEGVSHYSFLAECMPLGSRQLPNLCQEQPGVERSATHKTVAMDAVGFFNQIFRTH
ncbi:MAG: alpha/beta hydrolase family protein [Vicinamibacterales bacterium]